MNIQSRLWQQLKPLAKSSIKLNVKGGAAYLTSETI